MIKNLSNESLEQRIAAYYWNAQREVPGIRIKEAGVLGQLWAEFDERVLDGRVEIE